PQLRGHPHGRRSLRLPRLRCSDGAMAEDPRAGAETRHVHPRRGVLAHRVHPLRPASRPEHQRLPRVTSMASRIIRGLALATIVMLIIAGAIWVLPGVDRETDDP